MTQKNKRVVILNYADPHSNSNAFRIQILTNEMEEMGWEIKRIKNNIWGDHLNRVKMVKKIYPLIPVFLYYIYYYFYISLYLLFGKYDLVIIAYPAYLDIFPAKIICGLRKTPVVVDYFISLYDTIFLDRVMIDIKSPLAKVVYNFDRILLNIAPYVMVDTKANIRRYQSIYNLQDTANFLRVIVGSRYLFMPSLPSDTGPARQNSKPFRIGWLGSYIPLHGIDMLVNSVLSFKDAPNIEFLFIGEGQLLPYAKNFVEENNLRNITFIPQTEYPEAMRLIASCDICLGIFGESEKADAVIPCKIFDYLAMNKVVITKQSVAMHEIEALGNTCQIENDIHSLTREISSQLHSSSSDQVKDGVSRQKIMLKNDVTNLLEKTGLASETQDANRSDSVKSV